MKNIIRVITISSSFVLGMGVAGIANAADSTTGTANASIATALTLSPGAQPLSFGTFAHSDTSVPGTVTVNTADGVAASTNVDVDPTVTSGDFTITGEPNATVTITLPGSATLTHSGGAGSGQLDLGGFTDSQGGTLTLDGSGDGAFDVGATLAFDAIAQDQAGSYTGTYSVTVAYQ